MSLIKTHEDLKVFQQSIEAAVAVFQACRQLPPNEKYHLKAQWLRSSRSVPANLAEAWRKRYYRAHFLSKLSDAEGEAAECQVWALLAFRCGYLDQQASQRICTEYDRILRQLVTMANAADQWTFNRSHR